MIWQRNNLYLGCTSTNSEIAEAIAHAFRVQPQEVFVVAWGRQWENFTETTVIVCEVLRRQQDNFPLELFITTPHRIPEQPANHLETIGRLSETLDCQILAYSSYDSQQVGGFVLVSGNGSVQPVDIKETSDNGDFVIVAL